MDHNLRYDRRTVTVQQDEVVHTLLELTAPSAVASERPTLDVVLVLDRSGSMAGEPIRSVTEAAAELLRVIGPQDRIGVVAFDSQAQMVLPLARHDAEVAGRTLRSIGVGGSTNLSAGWLKAMEMLAADVREGTIRRIVVLTDGHANVGISDSDSLAELVGTGRCQGVTTSLIGFDLGYDEALLATLADAGAGNDYWCEGADQTAAVFNTEFDGLSSVVAQNLSVQVLPTSAVAAFEVLNDFPTTSVGDGVEVMLGDAYGDELRRLVVQFNLRPQSDAGDVHVADLKVSWASTGSGIELRSVVLPVTVRSGQPGETVSTDAEVEEQVLILKAAAARREAREQARRGDTDLAAETLRHGAAFMSRTRASVADVQELLADAAMVESAGWSEEQSKKQYSMSRATSRGRATRVPPRRPRGTT